MPSLRCFSVSFLYLLFKLIHGPWFSPKNLSYDWSNYNCRSSLCFIKLFIAYSIQYYSSSTRPVKEHGCHNLSSEKRCSQENSHGGIQSHNISKGASSNLQEGTSLVCLCYHSEGIHYHDSVIFQKWSIIISLVLVLSFLQGTHAISFIYFKVPLISFQGT